MPKLWANVEKELHKKNLPQNTFKRLLSSFSLLLLSNKNLKDILETRSMMGIDAILVESPAIQALMMEAQKKAWRKASIIF